MNKNNALIDDLLEDVSGGMLPPGWQSIADSLAPGYNELYPDITYEQACKKIDNELVGQYGVNANDGVLVKEYLKKYFDDKGYILPEYLK